MIRNPIKTWLTGIAILGLALTSCGSTEEVGEVEPVSFESVDELFDTGEEQDL